MLRREARRRALALFRTRRFPLKRVIRLLMRSVIVRERVRWNKKMTHLPSDPATPDECAAGGFGRLGGCNAFSGKWTTVERTMIDRPEYSGNFLEENPAGGGE